MTQQVDMSGAVYVDDRDEHGHVLKAVQSADLTPFTQGAIKAALGELQSQIDPASWPHDWALSVRFDWLAPETLAWFIAEGERYNAEGLVDLTDREVSGVEFWRCRQDGEISPVPTAFPPVRLELRDDGLIYVREDKDV